MEKERLRGSGRNWPAVKHNFAASFEIRARIQFKVPRRGAAERDGARRQSEREAQRGIG